MPRLTWIENLFTDDYALLLTPITLSAKLESMKRYYLTPNGTERLPTADERSHYGIAKTELAARNLPVGDTDACYEAMWRLGFVRMLDNGNRVYAEQYLAGRPIPVAEFTQHQREYLEGLILSGKPLFVNDTGYASTREGSQAAGQYSLLSDTQKLG